MEPTTRDLMNELKQIRVDINIIKDNVNEVDSQLSEEEERLLEESYENEERGELLSSEDLKKELACSS